MNVPTHLNGYKVIGSTVHSTCATVMVAKTPSEWVVATWWPELGTTWAWGHYVFSFATAQKVFGEVSERNSKRT